MTNSSRFFRTKKTAVGVALLLFVLTGCGNQPSDDGIATAGGAKGIQATASATPDAKSDHEKMLEFTRCMRKNGVDLPDPGSADTEARKRAMNLDRKALAKAFAACRKYAPSTLIDLRNDPKARKAMMD